MIDAASLVAALKKQVLILEDDLRVRLEHLPETKEDWQARHRRQVKADRTANAWTTWRDDQITQAAVAWVLTTVFIRFCEDNRLLTPVWITGPEDRRQEALDAQLAYFREHPDDSDREWLEQAIAHLGKRPATVGLVEEHSGLWLLSPSGQACSKLIAFWRQQREDGSLLYDFGDEGLSTRFLGDLYQDLSEHAKKTYALLQTPEFVEEFILDQTMEPALAERSLEGFKIIDPTCGSGHFLLGAFRRLLDRWDKVAPGMELQARVNLALGSVYGVDLNPFAVAIARFRLTVAALQACGLRSLENAPDFDYHVYAGDSLLYGAEQVSLPFDGADPELTPDRVAYATEDVDHLQLILRPGSYDAVVGNPPYITVKDKALNARYRELYSACKGTYALTVPFMQRFFGLAKTDAGDQPAGWVGLITSNSFMKREFGSKLIEDFLVKQDLRRVIDTSGAYIPGHGTPTVIIVGRHQRSVGSMVRAVLGIRGEPGRPAEPESGLVWTSIVAHCDAVDFENAWISVADRPREAFVRHPWSLRGGGFSALAKRITDRHCSLLDYIAPPIGGSIRVGADEAFIRPAGWQPRVPLVVEALRPLVIGEVVRDWTLDSNEFILLPYEYGAASLRRDGSVPQELWPWRALLAARVTFQGSMGDPDRSWWDYMQYTLSPYRSALSIAFAEVATHNHFVLDRGGKVFKQTAPVIKLPDGSREDDHLALLGVLNSSTACFWLKQNCYPKGGDPVGDSGARVSQQPWSDRYQYNGSNVQDCPIPSNLPINRARLLDFLARQLTATSAPEAVKQDTPSDDLLAHAHARYDSLRGQMIARQEELDWEVYGLYGLPGGDLVYDGDDLPELNLGERAFEIALARKVAAGEEETAWFARHGSTPITEIPTHWPPAYRDLVQRRLDLIESDPNIRLLEKPEHKRRWASEPWEKQQDAALRGWLLDRLEDKRFWFAEGRPAPKSIGQLADQVARDRDLTSVLELWEGRRDVPIVQSLTKLLADEAVPFLAAYRLKDSGLRKFEAWQETWALQRREDAGESVGTIPVPPKYTSADFRKQPWWQARGKLDVPKERFILYPDAGRATDPTPLLGWAGWDHAEQALALAMIIAEREEEGWADERLIPLVAGLAELQPWVEQWHSEIDPTYGISLAAFCKEQLAERSRQVGQSPEQLAGWRPEPTTRGRKARR
ncbi:MAG: BREX-2 system adenine-specific DNA-methyltransferase PglX [Microlunatus sp.]